MEKNWSYKITEGAHAGKTLWSGRYCAVAAFVFRRIEGIWAVLANKRGSGTPDYQGCWNAVCGFLEADEDAKHGCSREIFEETGYVIKPEKFLEVYTHTNPLTSNNANVTLRHLAIIFESEIKHKIAVGGEENEVDEVKWIPIQQIFNYTWAFDHAAIIYDLYTDYIEPLEYQHVSSGMFRMISDKEWIRNNQVVGQIVKKSLLKSFGLND